MSQDLLAPREAQYNLCSTWLYKPDLLPFKSESEGVLPVSCAAATIAVAAKDVAPAVAAVAPAPDPLPIGAYSGLAIGVILVLDGVDRLAVPVRLEPDELRLAAHGSRVLGEDADHQDSQNRSQAHAGWQKTNPFRISPHLL